MKWIRVFDNILNIESFKVFYIEEVPEGEFILFADDLAGTSWYLKSFSTYILAKESFDILSKELL